MLPVAIRAQDAGPGGTFDVTAGPGENGGTTSRGEPGWL